MHGVFIYATVLQDYSFNWISYMYNVNSGICCCMFWAFFFTPKFGEEKVVIKYISVKCEFVWSRGLLVWLFVALLQLQFVSYLQLYTSRTQARFSERSPEATDYRVTCSMLHMPRPPLLTGILQLLHPYVPNSPLMYCFLPIVNITRNLESARIRPSWRGSRFCSTTAVHLTHISLLVDD